LARWVAEILHQPLGGVQTFFYSEKLRLNRLPRSALNFSTQACRLSERLVAGVYISSASVFREELVVHSFSLVGGEAGRCSVAALALICERLSMLLAARDGVRRSPACLESCVAGRAGRGSEETHGFTPIVRLELDKPNISLQARLSQNDPEQRFSWHLDHKRLPGFDELLYLPLPTL
jgi:hypothetical protein